MIEGKFKAKNSRVALLMSLQELQPGQSRATGLLPLALDQYASSSTKVAQTARILSFSIILAVGGFFLATIREGHGWGDDFSLYILHARNIAEGISYQQTGYIYGLSIYLAYGARSIGLALLLCLLAYDLLKNRKPTAFAIKVAVTTGTLVAIQSVFPHSDSAYADQLGINLSGIIGRILEYSGELSGLLAGTSNKVFRLLLVVAISGLAIIGYFTKVNRQITFLELFPVVT
jgi:hypothetical protein